MFRKLYDGLLRLITESRKGQIFTAAWVLNALVSLGSVLSLVLHWGPDQLVNWNTLVAGLREAFSQIGQLTGDIAKLWPLLIALEDAAHKFGLPPPASLVDATAKEA